MQKEPCIRIHVVFVVSGRPLLVRLVYTACASKRCSAVLLRSGVPLIFQSGVPLVFKAVLRLSSKRCSAGLQSGVPLCGFGAVFRLCFKAVVRLSSMLRACLQSGVTLVFKAVLR